jgi:hypothetical protein
MRILYVLLMTLFFTAGCNKDGDKNFNLSATKYLKNKELFNCVTCFSVINIHACSGFAIRNENTYNLYADSMRIHPLNSNCDTATLLNIDFNKYTLIGIMTGLGACDSITRNIAVDNKNERINYNIDIKESKEPCNDMLYLPLNLMLIPKIPDNYNVVFKINRH